MEGAQTWWELVPATNTRSASMLCFLRFNFAGDTQNRLETFDHGAVRENSLGQLEHWISHYRHGRRAAERRPDSDQ